MLVDGHFNREVLFGGGHLQFTFIYLLELHGTPRRDLAIPSHYTAGEVAGLLPPGSVVILHDAHRAQLAPLKPEPLFVVTPEMRKARVGFTVYRIGPR